MNPNRSRPITRLLCAGVLALASLAVGTQSHAAEKPEANSVERARPYLQPSIVLLGTDWRGVVYDGNLKMYVGEENFVLDPGDAKVFLYGGICTGYAISSQGHIATAGHCVDPQDEDVEANILDAAATWAIDKDFYENPPGRADLIKYNDLQVRNQKKGAGADVSIVAAWDIATGDVESGKSYPARLLDFASFEKGDGALLKTEVNGILAVPLSTENIEIGKDIVAIGFPGSVQSTFDPDLKPSYNDGKVSGEATGGGLFKAYELTAKINGGMSGGPVVNTSAEVIGFTSFSILDRSPIGYARPVEFIREIMNAKGVKNSLDATSKSYDAGLDAYFRGDKDTAVDELSKVVDAQEDNTVAEEFLKKADALPDPANPLPVIGGLIIVLVGAIAGVLFAMRRMGSKKPTPVAAPAYAPVMQPAGQPVPATADLPGRFCTSCGKAASTGERFCSHCGSALPADF